MYDTNVFTQYLVKEKLKLDIKHIRHTKIIRLHFLDVKLCFIIQYMARIRHLTFLYNNK